MTLSELATALNATLMPVRYGHYSDKETLSTPYIEYEVAYSRNFVADGHVYKKYNFVDIFLFTSIKDLTSEGKVETALADTTWNKTENYLSEERAYQIIYEVKIDG